MGIAYKLPFEAYLIINPNTYAKRLNLGPWFDTSANFSSTGCGTEIEENEEIDLYFNSADSNAKLYLDALDCCPVTSRIMVDDDGLLYCIPADDIIKIYRSDSNYDALRVDTLQISVVCNSNTYLSFLQIVPKQLTFQEWAIMRDDLENEMEGLAQDAARINMGIGSESQGVLPPDDLHAFLIINQNAQAIMSALLDIKDRPKYKLQKRYEEADTSMIREIDTQTIERYLRRGAPNNKFMVPRRDIIYDIQENRLLKKIVKTYDEKLSHFIKITTETLHYRRQQLLPQYPNHNLYDTKYIDILESYLKTVEKLRKITNIIKNAEWFRNVKNLQDAFIPHSFVVDSRYGTLYKIYSKMNKHNFPIQLDSKYSYSWKKSSLLYEMWCYICVCRHFLHKYSPRDSKWDNIFIKDHLFPFLEPGTKITMENEKAVIEIIYDVQLPRSSEHAQLYNHPLYITGRHYRPDMCINMYSKKSEWYVGSFVIECKYRKLNAFWNGKTWSSREQIIAYHNDSNSQLFFNGYFNMFTAIRPVHQVFVFTPDIFDEKAYPDDKVKIKTFKPTKNKEYVDEVCDAILHAVNDQISRADLFYGNIQANGANRL